MEKSAKYDQHGIHILVDLERVRGNEKETDARDEHYVLKYRNKSQVCIGIGWYFKTQQYQYQK